MTDLTDPTRRRADRAVLLDEPTRFVFETMGTVASLAVPAGLDATTRLALLAEFDRLETRFTMYEPRSEARLVSSGELPLRQASTEYRAVQAAAQHWHLETGGAFTPYPPSGGIDLTGIVKGWAIAAGGEILDDAGVSDWCLNVGGDLLVRGDAAPTRPWVAGIVDPSDRTKLATAVSLTPSLRGLATSGYSERGDHIWRPVAPAAADARFIQVTVVADEIIKADVMATAILAGGPATMLELLVNQQVEVLAIDAAGRTHATSCFAANCAS